MKHSGEKIREVRRAKNLTGEQLGKLAGVSKSYIARAESGEDISLEFAFKIEKALGLHGDISDLVIQAARMSAGLEGQVISSQPANHQNLNLEAIWLSQNCGHCGNKNSFKISLGA